MNYEIDTSFDVYSDTPSGKDPDSHSPTLRRYHQSLWSKRLPNGNAFRLSTQYPKSYLHHQSDIGEFHLSSDSIGHTYRYVKAMEPIISSVPKQELDSFFRVCSTVGAYIIFPSRRIGGKPTINGARGMHWKIKDRFDLTLECIRRHYAGEASPLSETLARYADFFALFEDFSGYVDFFLLQDATNESRNSVRFFLPFRGFDASPLPANLEEYAAYRDSLMHFVAERNVRIAAGR